MHSLTFTMGGGHPILCVGGMPTHVSPLSSIQWDTGAEGVKDLVCLAVVDIILQSVQVSLERGVGRREWV